MFTLVDPRRDRLVAPGGWRDIGAGGKGDYEYPDDAPDLEVAGGHGPDPGSVQTVTTSQLNRPLVWIAERDGPEPTLRVGTRYILHIQMGDPASPTLVQGGVGDIPVEDIPEEGLMTEWIVRSEEVELSPEPDDPEVQVALAEVGPSKRRIWTARFRLLVLREGDSAIRRLGITPICTRRARLAFSIYAASDREWPYPRHELCRKFDLDLPLVVRGAIHFFRLMWRSLSACFSRWFQRPAL